MWDPIDQVRPRPPRAVSARSRLPQTGPLLHSGRARFKVNWPF